MAIIKPFTGVRPTAELAAQVASLPYDVMNTKEAKTMAEGNPFSFLHVSRAEIDFADGIDEHSAEVYQKARHNFYTLIADGTLIKDPQPCIYIYAQAMNGRTQVGIVACSSIQDYFNNVIKKHEFTRPEKEEDRIKHMETLQAQVGPIFLTYPQNNTIDSLVQQIITTQKPAYNFTANDAVQHTVWVVSTADTITEICTLFETQIPYTYIADGHHRTASAAKVGLKLKAQNPHHTGNEPYNFFLSVLFPHNQLAIMDYNRLVTDLNGHTQQQLLDKIAIGFDIEKTNLSATEIKPTQLHHFAMYMGGSWYKLVAKPALINPDPIGILDVTILQQNVLAPLLRIQDPRTSNRVDFVGGIRGLQELQRRVDTGDMQVAFAFYPVSVQQLMNIADSGHVMPPKSTWFEPKLRDGLLSHLL